ncbi:MAG: hypothetical protein V1740_00730 [Candidatus Woesearchaeota archaeon]
MNKDDIIEDFAEGDKEADVYSEEGTDSLVENDEISPEEAGFMEGEMDRGERSVCSHCSKVIGEDRGRIVEREINGKVHWFCCDDCAENGLKAVQE